MIILYILLFLSIVIGCSINECSLDNALSKQASTSIKGVCILLVFIRHIIPYITRCGYEYNGWGDTVFLNIDKSLGQFIVVMFLFYSGYGVTLAIKEKGMPYILGIPVNRMLGVIINFDIAVLAFLVVQTMLGVGFPVRKIILSMIGWDTLGNSNWYIFVVLLCYATSFFASLCFRSTISRLIMLFSLILIIFLALVRYRPLFWSNTIFSYFLGAMFAEFLEGLRVIFKKYISQLTTIAVIALLCLIVLPPDRFNLRDNILSMFVALNILVLVSRISLTNRILMWCGASLFPLYIYQRLPMIIFSEVLDGQIVMTSPLVYIGICAIFTFLFAYYYRYFKVSFR